MLYEQFLPVFFPINEKPTIKVSKDEEPSEPSKPKIETEFSREETVLSQLDEAVVPNVVKTDVKITKDEALTSSESTMETKEPAISVDEKHLEEIETKEEKTFSNETKSSQ